MKWSYQQAMSDTNNEWLTIAQSASQLGISERQVRRYARRLDPDDRRDSGREAGQVSGSSPALVRITALIEVRERSKRVSTNSNSPDITPDMGPAGTGHLSGSSRLSRVEGYVARDLEIIIGKAIEQAVSNATAPLLARIEQLTEAHASLSGHMEAQAAAHTLLMDDLKESRKDRAMLRAELAKLTEGQQEPPAVQASVEEAVDKSLVPYLKKVQEVSAEVDRVNEQNEQLKAALVKAEREATQLKAAQLEAARRSQRPWWKLW
jgi:hypothetical protein